MHANLLPSVNQDKCIGCGKCKKWCPADAITIDNKKSYINSNKCIGCMECVTVCPTGAISVMFGERGKKFPEKMAEYVYAVLKNKGGKVGFFSFLMDITPHCDCASWSDASIVPDVGILASKDPVAIEQASLDLINGQPGLKGTALKNSFAVGEDKFKDLFPNVDTQLQIKYAEELGLGTREYDLIEI